MSVTAKAKGIRISPRKVGVVASLVRGHSVADALTILDHTPRRAALPISKVIKSARSNAENNHDYKPDSLKLVSIIITPGPRMKRFRPIAHGRAHPYIKRSSHIFVEVDGEKRAIKKKDNDRSEGKKA